MCQGNTLGLFCENLTYFELSLFGCCFFTRPMFKKVSFLARGHICCAKLSVREPNHATFERWKHVVHQWEYQGTSVTNTSNHLDWDVRTFSVAESLQKSWKQSRVSSAVCAHNQKKCPWIQTASASASQKPWCHGESRFASAMTQVLRKTAWAELWTGRDDVQWGEASLMVSAAGALSCRISWHPQMLLL